MRIALPPVLSQERTEIILARMENGRYLYESGFSRAACRNQDEEAGYDAAEMDVPQLPPLQQLIDELLDTEEYEDDIEDRNIWRKGQW